MLFASCSPGGDEAGVPVALGMDHHVGDIVHQAEGDISDLAIVAAIVHPGEGWTLENEGGF